MRRDADKRGGGKATEPSCRNHHVRTPKCRFEVQAAFLERQLTHETAWGGQHPRQLTSVHLYECPDALGITKQVTKGLGVPGSLMLPNSLACLEEEEKKHSWDNMVRGWLNWLSVSRSLPHLFHLTKRCVFQKPQKQVWRVHPNKQFSMQSFAYTPQCLSKQQTRSASQWNSWGHRLGQKHGPKRGLVLFFFFGKLHLSHMKFGYLKFGNIIQRQKKPPKLGELKTGSWHTSQIRGLLQDQRDKWVGFKTQFADSKDLYLCATATLKAKVRVGRPRSLPQPPGLLSPHLLGSAPPHTTSGMDQWPRAVGTAGKWGVQGSLYGRRQFPRALNEIIRQFRPAPLTQKAKNDFLHLGD